MQLLFSLLLLLLLLLLSMMILIIGFTCPSTTYFKFITKCDSLFYYKVRWSFTCITKSGSFSVKKVRPVLLQRATILLQNATEHGTWNP